jgi:3-dehydroquinate dehydratase I
MSLFFGYDMPPGLIPLVVGVVSTPEGLDKVVARDDWPCDIVEIRLDLIGDDTTDWPVAARHLTNAGVGTLLTIRHPSEGGRWTGDENERLDCYVQGLPHVTGIDIELSASIVPDLVALAKGKASIIGSYHQFRQMPDAQALRDLVAQGEQAGVDVVKIAAFAAEPAEKKRMMNLLEEHPDACICTLAMGPMAASSRIEFPLAGSCLTYGYLDKPNVNGQPSAAALREQLMEKLEAYRLFAGAREGAA